jgi:hypothetical protein
VDLPADPGVTEAGDNAPNYGDGHYTTSAISRR